MANEIKKAFEIFKKEIAKELDFNDWQKSGFTMSKRQIELRTATYLACNSRSFEHEIEAAAASIAKVMTYDTWTDEAKARHKADHQHVININEEMMARYGTKSNMLVQVKKDIEASKAFAKLQEVLGPITLTTETKEDFYNYIRFNY